MIYIWLSAIVLCIVLDYLGVRDLSPLAIYGPMAIGATVILIYHIVHAFLQHSPQ